jgi:hypothetical protein
VESALNFQQRSETPSLKRYDLKAIFRKDMFETPSLKRYDLNAIFRKDMFEMPSLEKYGIPQAKDFLYLPFLESLDCLIFYSMAAVC